METKTITINVNVEAARIFQTISVEERRKLEALVNLRLTSTTRQKRTLEEVMNDISEKAQARGLTPEILESILNEE